MRILYLELGSYKNQICYSQRFDFNQKNQNFILKKSHSANCKMGFLFVPILLNTKKKLNTEHFSNALQIIFGQNQFLEILKCCLLSKRKILNKQSKEHLQYNYFVFQ